MKLTPNQKKAIWGAVGALIAAVGAFFGLAPEADSNPVCYRAELCRQVHTPNPSE